MNSSFTAHALHRAADRAGTYLTAPEATAAIERAERAALASGGLSLAVVVHRLAGQAGVPWSERSNGDLLVAIIRHGRVQTVMLRRSTQPFTATALRVARAFGPAVVPAGAWV